MGERSLNYRLSHDELTVSCAARAIKIKRVAVVRKKVLGTDHVLREIGVVVDVGRVSPHFHFSHGTPQTLSALIVSRRVKEARNKKTHPLRGCVFLRVRLFLHFRFWCCFCSICYRSCLGSFGWCGSLVRCNRFCFFSHSVYINY